MDALSGRQVRLTAGGTVATVAQVGAGLRTLEHAGTPVLDGYADDEIAAYAQGQALVPWPNRLADGRYRFGGEELQLPLTEPENGCAIHGLARWLRWNVVEAAADRAVLRTPIAPQAGYPFALLAEVEYRLAPGALAAAVTLHNQGPSPAPAGAGFHPYIMVGTATIDDAILTSPATRRLEADDRGIPTGALSDVAGTDADFREPRAIGATQLDTAFTGLTRDDDGRARVTLAAPGGGPTVTLWLGEGFEYLMLFTGDALPDPRRRRRALGVEPMTCAPDAYNSGDGLVTLEPGASATWRWGIDVGG